LFKTKVVKIDNDANGEFHNGWGLTGMRLMQGNVGHSLPGISLHSSTGPYVQNRG
jgi:hypothetical protein